MMHWKITFSILIVVLMAWPGCGSGNNGADDDAAEDVAGEDLSDMASDDFISPDGPDTADIPGDEVELEVAPEADVPSDGTELEVIDCADPMPARELAIHTNGGMDISLVNGTFIVLTGMAPAEVETSPVAGVHVNGSARSVYFDPDTGVWTWIRFLSDLGADVSVEAVDASGASLASISVNINTGAASPVEEDLLFYPTDHFIGAWMFTWFTGDTGWACHSPWVPVETFEAWDGSPDWARKQMLDQMDANIDVIGLQYDWSSAEGPRGYRWSNVRNAIEAARTLLEDGMTPARIFPFVDTAIIAHFYEEDHGRTIDLAISDDFEYFYGFLTTFYNAFNEIMGNAFSHVAGAQMSAKPFVGFWHSVTMDNESEGVITDMKTRFETAYGVQPYFIAHPNDWRNYSGIDEITLMFGPPENFYAGGRDSNGGETINIEPGFWNPLSNPFYVPREGGVHFLSAWDQALARRGDVEHLYIDSWNETGEGSGIFEAQPTSFSASDTGPCGEFVNLHDESWGPDARYYINVVSEKAASWNDRPALDARLPMADVPASMQAGQRRWVSVVARNAGNTPWTEGGDFTIQPGGAGSDFGVESRAVALRSAELENMARIPRGAVSVFQFLLTAPCPAGTYTLTFQMSSAGTPFGDVMTKEIEVIE